MTDNKNTNELNDEELDTVNGGLVAGLNPMRAKLQNTKANPDLDNIQQAKNGDDLINLTGTKKDLDNLTGFGKGKDLNPFNAKFGLGKKFGRDQEKLED